MTRSIIIFVITLITNSFLPAQDLYFMKKNGLDSSWVYHSKISEPCEVIDSFVFHHQLTTLHSWDRRLKLSYEIDDKREKFFYYGSTPYDISGNDDFVFYEYTIADRSIRKLFTLKNRAGVLFSINYIDKKNTLIVTDGSKINVFDLNTNELKTVSNSINYSLIFTLRDSIYLKSFLYHERLYSFYLDDNFRIEKLHRISDHIQFSDVVRTDCYGACKKNAKCLTNKIDRIPTKIYYNSLLSVDFNNWDKELDICYLDGVYKGPEGQSHLSFDIVDFHLLLDLDKSDDYCDNAHLELSLPCGSNTATLATAAPQLTSTAEHVDSMQVYLSSSDGAYISVGNIPSTLRVSGDQSSILWVYNTGSASLSDYADLIRGLTYHRGPSSKMSDQMIFLLHYEHHISEAAIATITTSDGSPAYAGRDTTLTFCETDTPVALSQYIPRGADAGGAWLSTATHIDPSLGATTHRYVVSNACNADTATLSIAVTPKALQDISIDTLICAGDTFSIDGKTFTRDTAFAYDRLSSAMPCGGWHYEIRVRVEQPTLDIEYPTTPLCAGDPPVTLSIAEQTGYTYLWSDGLDSTQRVVFESGEYALQATSPSGCTLHDTVTVMYHPKPLLELTQQTYREQQGTPITLDITTKSGIRIEWTPSIGLSCTDCPDPQLTVQDSIDYFVSVRGESGCISSDTVFIRLQPTPEAPTADLVLPSIIHPNSDIDANRYFGIVSSTVQSYDLAIYSRWGNKVFEQLNINPNTQKGWNGSQHTTDLNTGVYVYSIQYTDSTGKTQQKVGTVTLVR